MAICSSNVNKIQLLKERLGRICENKLANCLRVINQEYRDNILFYNRIKRKSSNPLSPCRYRTPPDFSGCSAYRNLNSLKQDDILACDGRMPCTKPWLTTYHSDGYEASRNTDLHSRRCSILENLHQWGKTKEALRSRRRGHSYVKSPNIEQSLLMHLLLVPF